MLLVVILCQKCDLWSRFGGRSEVFTEAGPRWVVSFGGGVCPVEGGCSSLPSLPWWGEGRRGVYAPCPLSPALPGKGLGNLVLAVGLLGPRPSSWMIPLVPGSLAFICLFLVVVLSRCNRQGPIKKSPSEGDTPVDFWHFWHAYFTSNIQIQEE